MKVFLLLLWAYCPLASGLLHAQQTPTVTLTVKDMPLEKVIQEVKKQTGYTFFYDDALLAKTAPVSIDAKDMPVETFLKAVLEMQSLGFSRVNTTVIISRLPAPAHPSAPSSVVPAPQDTIRGLVEDKNGTPMVAVTVTINPQALHRRISVMSQSNGGFEIPGQKGDKLIFTEVGHKKREIKYNGEHPLRVTMETQADSIDNVIVETGDFNRKKIPFTDTIDMTNRGYMNLGQILQGTIPGLTLQYSSQSQQTLTGITLAGILSMNAQQLQAFYNQNTASFIAVGITSYNALVSYIQQNNAFPGATMSLSANYTTSINNSGLIPQLRGVSGFDGNTSGMLIVIDGFPQTGFPANFPMSDVESVKVIKDPEELTKWGPSAAGGVVLIATKKGQAGKLSIHYSSSYYYSAAPRFNRSRQQLASTADVLDYMKSAYDSGFLSLGVLSAGLYNPFNLTPAALLLQGLEVGTLSQAAFNSSWDSLGKISNDGQYRLLEQSIFNQTHLLTLSGGTKAWNFSVAGSYMTNRTNALDNYSHTPGLTMMNNLQLFDKNKLRVYWYLSLNDNKSAAGSTANLTTLQPYQLLLDPKGNYVYDYSGFNPEANAIMESYGYENYGVNILQDARVNQNITRTLTTNSALNLDWDLLPGLKWSNAVMYTGSSSRNFNLEGAASSAARQTVDNYGSPVDSSGPITGIDFYIPPGGILQVSHTKAIGWNVRSALLYNQDFGKSHLSLTLGGGEASNVSREPAYPTIYGYSSQTGQGQAVQLPSSGSTNPISNYLAIPLPATSFPYSWGTNGISGSYPYTLLTPNEGDTMIQRTLNYNGSARYSFDNAFIVKGSYNAVLNSNYGYTPPYTTLAAYSGEVQWRLSRYDILALPDWISDVSLSTGVEGIQIPNLPVQIAASQLLQSDWNNYTEWVSSYTAAQESGQNAHNVYEKLSWAFARDKLGFYLSYNTLYSYNTPQTDGGDANTTQHYLGAGAKLMLRGGALLAKADHGRSLDGYDQTNAQISYDIHRESYFHSSTISKLSADFTLKNISPYQGMMLMQSTNAPLPNGGFSVMTNNNFGLLPSQVTNLEVHSTLGLLKDRYLLDVRYYRKTTSGLNNSIPVPTDPSTGLATQVSYSEIVNRGVEAFLRIEAVKGKRFSYTVTLNGAYNGNIAKSLPTIEFSETPTYLAAPRDGYSTEGIWSYRWAGLDASGNPQIYNSKGQKMTNPDSTTLASSMVYSGVTRAPYTAGLIQEWHYVDFFARVTFLVNLGDVMREYLPSPSGTPDQSSLISERWRAPGDEAHTDIAAMSSEGGPGTVRALIIQNSTNSLMSAGYIQLQQAQIGWMAPQRLLQHSAIKQLTLSLQGQNLAVWSHNKMHVDPEVVSTTGQIGLPIPRQYSFTIDTGF